MCTGRKRSLIEITTIHFNPYISSTTKPMEYYTQIAPKLYQGEWWDKVLENVQIVIKFDYITLKVFGEKVIKLLAYILPGHPKGYTFCYLELKSLVFAYIPT